MIVIDKMDTTETKEKRFRFIEPVLQIPPRRKRRHSVYDEIIDEFIESGLRCVEVKNFGRNPIIVCTALKSRLKKRGLESVKVRIRNQKVYLEKVDLKNLSFYMTEHGTYSSSKID